MEESRDCSDMADHSEGHGRVDSRVLGVLKKAVSDNDAMKALQRGFA